MGRKGVMGISQSRIKGDGGFELMLDKMKGCRVSVK